MKVIKVIVDKLPEGCTNCDFDDYMVDNALGECMILGKEFEPGNSFLCPDWCPLVEEDPDAISVIREYVESVQNLISEIISACTYQDEPTAASGRYELPMRCFTDMERLSELSHEIYDSILEE